MKASGVLAIAGLIGLAFFIGAWWQLDRIRHAPTKTTWTIVERPIFIRAKPAVVAPARPVPPDSSRQKIIDALTRRASEADSIEMAYRASLCVRRSTREESLEFSDSLVSIHVAMTRYLEYDPATLTFRDSVSPTVAILKHPQLMTVHSPTPFKVLGFNLVELLAIAVVATLICGS